MILSELQPRLKASRAGSGTFNKVVFTKDRSGAFKPIPVDIANTLAKIEGIDLATAESRAQVILRDIAAAEKATAEAEAARMRRQQTAANPPSKAALAEEIAEYEEQLKTAAGFRARMVGKKRDEAERKISNFEQTLDDHNRKLAAQQAEIEALEKEAAELLAKAQVHQPIVNAAQQVARLRAMNEFFWASVAHAINEKLGSPVALPKYEFVTDASDQICGLYCNMLNKFEAIDSLSIPAFYSATTPASQAIMASILALTQQPDIQGNAGTCQVGVDDDGAPIYSAAMIDWGLGGYNLLNEMRLLYNGEVGQLPSPDTLLASPPERFLVRLLTAEHNQHLKTKGIHNLQGAQPSLLATLCEEPSRLCDFITQAISTHQAFVQLVENTDLEELELFGIHAGLIDKYAEHFTAELAGIKACLTADNLSRAVSGLVTHVDLAYPRKLDDKVEFVFNLVLGAHQALCQFADPSASVELEDIIAAESFARDLNAAMTAARITDHTAAELIAARRTPAPIVVAAAEEVVVATTATTQQGASTTAALLAATQAEEELKAKLAAAQHDLRRSTLLTAAAADSFAEADDDEVLVVAAAATPSSPTSLPSTPISRTITLSRASSMASSVTLGSTPISVGMPSPKVIGGMDVVEKQAAVVAVPAPGLRGSN